MVGIIVERMWIMVLNFEFSSGGGNSLYFINIKYFWGEEGGGWEFYKMLRSMCIYLVGK